MGVCGSKGAAGGKRGAAGAAYRASSLQGLEGSMEACGTAPSDSVVRHYAACAVGYGHNQDRVSVVANVGAAGFYAGVFDGHGESAGAVSAEAAAKNVPRVICEMVCSGQGGGGSATAGAPAASPPNLAGAVKESFRLHQNRCKEVYETVTLKEVLELKAKLEAEAGVDDIGMTYPHEGGTTATVAVVHGTRLLVGWVGDSRAVLASLGDDDNALTCAFATADHGVGNQSEVDRVNAAGGITFGRYFAANGCDGMLQLSRSLGDVGFHRGDVVLAEPEVWERDVSERDMFLCMASDGVWGLFSNEDLVNFVHKELRDCGYVRKCASQDSGGAAAPSAEGSSTASGAGATAGAGAGAGGAEEGMSPEQLLLLVAHRVEAEAHRRARTRNQKQDDVSVALLTFRPFKWAGYRARLSATPVPDAAVAGQPGASPATEPPALVPAPADAAGDRDADVVGAGAAAPE